MVSAACLTAPAPPPPNYYVIDYQQSADAAGTPAQPVSAVVLVLDGRVNRTYERRQIVQRSDGPQIVYLAGEMWGVDLGVAFADLVADSLRARTVFTEIHRQHRTVRPELEIHSELRVLEHICCDGPPRARVMAVLTLRRAADEGVLVEHRFERRDPLPDREIATFVLRVNAVMLEEIDEFADRILQYFDGQV